MEFYERYLETPQEPPPAPPLTLSLSLSIIHTPVPQRRRSRGRYRLVVLESISFDSALMLAQEPAVVSCTKRAFREETKSQIFHGAVEYSFQSGPFRLVFHCSNGVLMVPEATRPSITALGLYMLRAVYSRCLQALPCEPQQCFFSSPIHSRQPERCASELWHPLSNCNYQERRYRWNGYYRCS